MVLGDPQELRHVFARPFLEDAQSDDRALNLAQLGHARPQTQLVDRSVHEIFGNRDVAIGELERIDFVVRTRAKMPAAMVARGVAHDRRQDRHWITDLGDLPRLNQVDERAEAILHAVDRVFRTQPFASRDGGEVPALGLRNLQHPVEQVFFARSVHEARTDKVLATSKITARIS